MKKEGKKVPSNLKESLDRSRHFVSPETEQHQPTPIDLDHAVMNEHPAGNYTVALAGRTSVLVAPLECYGAGQNVPIHTFGVAFSSGLFFTAMSGGREGQRKTGVSWRCDGR